MNTYKTEFFANCPKNGMRIKYFFEIESEIPILVEDIITEVAKMNSGYHEDIADILINSIHGNHTLTADHHGVIIVTTRTHKEDA